MKLINIIENKGYEVYNEGDFFEIVIGKDVIYVDRVDPSDFFRLEMEYINKHRHLKLTTRNVLNEILEELNKGEC